ncbi:MAG TPA: zinc ABC transporter substrate-binding protein [Mycobacterium sp.]|nr:zinc ABC transporter substrate-binding protein [Mycobacterium sp.]
MLAGCASNAHKAEPSGGSDCPVRPVDVVVSVDQWGDIVSELGGGCANVKTLLASSSVDPHDFEPAPADAAIMSGAQLVVVNGGHYDEWATKLAKGSAPNAPVVNAITDPNTQNPHVWYDPSTVSATADRVTEALKKVAPDAADYFSARRTAFGSALQPYDALIAKIRTGAAGKTYAATEGVFDDMAAAVGLIDRTPPGYAAAARNESDPSPADLSAFFALLKDKGVNVLIYNTQTEGSVPQQVRAAAQAAGIPVVEVTETVAPGAKSFESWQVDQLTALAKALGVSV